MYYYDITVLSLIMLNCYDESRSQSAFYHR